MPLYEYECLVCGRHTEKIQKFSDPEITHCPHCAGTLRRVITAPAFALKGGGWYADGYASAKPAAGGGGEAAAASAPASESSTPAAASPAAPAASSSTPAASGGAAKT